MDKKVIKYFGIAASIIGAIATIVSSYCDKKELEADMDEIMDAKMDEKIQKALAEKAESEEK